MLDPVAPALAYAKLCSKVVLVYEGKMLSNAAGMMHQLAYELYSKMPRAVGYECGFAVRAGNNHLSFLIINLTIDKRAKTNHAPERSVVRADQILTQTAMPENRLSEACALTHIE